VAFAVGGCTHAQYSKILKQHLGLSAVIATTFIKLLQPVAEAMLTDMYNNAKAAGNEPLLHPTVFG